MTENQSGRFDYNARGTYRERSSSVFAEETAVAIATAAKKWRPRGMAVRGYTPPYEPEYFPQGYLEIVFLQDGEPERSIGIEFGQTDGNGQFQRAAFNPEDWLEDLENPLSAAVTAINFDEAWRIVCLVGRRLDINDVSLGYGY